MRWLLPSASLGVVQWASINYLLSLPCHGCGEEQTDFFEAEAKNQAGLQLVGLAALMSPDIGLNRQQT